MVDWRSRTTESVVFIARTDGLVDTEGREGERDSRFSAAFSPRFFAVDVVVRNRKGKMRVGNDGLDCRRDDALRWMAGVK